MIHQLFDPDNPVYYYLIIISFVLVKHVAGYRLQVAGQGFTHYMENHLYCKQLIINNLQPATCNMNYTY